MLVIVDLSLVALIALALWAATRRGRSRANRARAVRAVSGLADLIPGRPVGGVAVRPPLPLVVPGVAASRATWSASSERGETALHPPTAPPEVRLEPPPIGPASLGPALLDPVSAPTNGVARAARKAVVVAPRERSWVVRRDGASRVSSVHSSRDAAEARGRKTARRDQVVLEVRDEESALLARTDYSQRGGATG